MQINCDLYGALIANALHYYVGLFGRIAAREINGRYFHFRQTLCFVTDFAMKMHMNILRVIAFTGIGTDRIFHGTRSIIDAVDDLMILEGF